jgi:hypothetical protein
MTKIKPFYCSRIEYIGKKADKIAISVSCLEYYQCDCPVPLSEDNNRN